MKRPGFFLFKSWENFLISVGDFGMLSFEFTRECFTRPFYPRLVLQQIFLIGYQSFLLVVVTALATGSVMALQFGYGLAKFGGTLYVPKVVAIIILREMGPVFTSLLVAGRIGSGIAAEVGAMKVSQQIDAIRALGTSPMKKIIIPRVLASLIALPLLTLFADVISLLGASLVGFLELHINPEYFYTKALESVRLYDLFTGLAKTLCFSFFVSLLACWKGLKTEGGTQGVGHSTTWVVVTASIFILISDFFLTKFFILTVYPR